MERSSESDEKRSLCEETIPPAGSNHMAVLGIASTANQPQIHSETQTGRPNGRVTTGNVLLLLQWQQYRCALTGRILTPETASLDHIVPVRSGGEHRIENAQILHRDVNKAKATMTNDEFIQLCREVAAHTA